MPTTGKLSVICISTDTEDSESDSESTSDDSELEDEAPVTDLAGIGDVLGKRHLAGVCILHQPLNPFLVKKPPKL